MATLVANSRRLEALEGEGPVHPEGLEPAGVVGRLLEARQHGVDPHRPATGPAPSGPGQGTHGEAATATCCHSPAPGALGTPPAHHSDTLWGMAPIYCTPDEAAALIRTRDTIGFGLGPANPDAFFTALGRRDDWEDLLFGGALLLGFYPVLAHPNVTYRCGFFGPAERMMLAQGANIDLVPGGFRQMGPILRRYAPRVIAAQARAYITDGATLQIGIGAVPNMVASKLAESPGGGYGVHSEMFTDGLMKLHQAGKVTNDAKGLFDGVSVTTFALGSAELYAWLDGNEQVAFLPVEVVNDPTEIAKNNALVSINGGLSVDLYGQVVADHIDGKQISGVGGHEDFVAGAEMRLDDHSLICLRSTAVS